MANEMQDPRTYFAAERTFLAWVRTGLGLMGVGFAVARFGLFLRQLGQTESHAPMHSTGLSVYSGVGLVALGVVVNVSAVIQHFRTVARLKEGTWSAGVSVPGITLAVVLGTVGCGMGVYLLMLR